MFDRDLLALLPEARNRMIACVVARLLALLCLVTLFFWAGHALGLGDAEGDSFAVWVPVASVVGFGAFSAAASWFSARAGSSAANTLDRLVFQRVVDLGPTRANVMGDAEVSQLMGEGVELLRPYFAKYLPQFFYAVLAPIALFVIALRLNVLAAVVMIVCVPLMPASIMMLMRRAKRFMGDYWGTYVDLGGAFLDAVRGLTTLVVFGSDDRVHERLDAQAEEFRQITMKLLRVQLNSVTFMDLFTFGGVAIGMAVAVAQVAFGALDGGNALVLCLMAASFFMPMRTFGSYFHTGMNAGPVIDQVKRLMNAPDAPQGTQAIQGEQITIEARGLGFCYGAAGEGAGAAADETTGADDAFALRAINLTIRPNSFIGIAGPSGSGKSTLAAVLSGAVAGYTGTCAINGVELADATTESLYNTVTVVGRESHVFRGSFRSNLLIAAPDAPDGALWDALRQARLADFVLESGGLDALVDAGGANLSGGQRQRLVFARALLRNTPVYVFDEATSNIDAQSERFLLAAIQKIALSKTVIVISHRLATLRYADQILVMDKGGVVQRGVHEQLVMQEGPYRSMWLQTAELESFAAQVVEELPDEEPDALEEALASMPGMMSGVMRAFVGIMEAERYRGASADMPAGHPAWIPLPDYKPGISREDADAGADAGAAASAESGADAAEDADAAEGAGIPSFMTGLADATADGADAQAIKDAMAVVRDRMTAAPVARVTVDPLPPAKRSAFTIIAKCLKLTGALAPRLALAAVLGALGWLAAIGVFVFTAMGVLAAAGVAVPVPLAGCIAGAIVCALVRGPLHYAERLQAHDSTFLTVASIRSQVFAALRKLAPAKIEGRDAGDLISLLTSDIQILEGFYSRACAPVLAAVIALVCCCVAAAVVSPVIACVAVVTYVLAGFVLPSIALRITRDRAAELRAYAVLMTGFLLDSLSGMADLLRFGRAQEYVDEMADHLKSYAAGEGGHACAEALLEALPSMVAYAGAAIATALAVGGSLDAGAGVVLVVGLFASIDVVCSVAGLGTSFSMVLAAADRVLDILEESPVVEDVPAVVSAGVSADGAPGAPGVADAASPVAAERESFEGLEFRAVNFGYVPGALAVEDATFAVDPGSFVGITGASGAGKTTLLKLAQRFWDVDSGCVLLNGRDVRLMPLARVRSLISYMTQTTYVFEDTLRENLIVAKPDATDDQLRAACDAAALTEVVDQLPLGLDTPLGQGRGAVQLSDGQRQRVGLARAFLHGAPLMLLDEPTSNLDALNEAAILRSLCTNAEGSTVVIVSHRKAVAAIVDKLLVVEK